MILTNDEIAKEQKNKDDDISFRLRVDFSL